MNHRQKLLATAILLAACAGAQAQIYKATLTGANEVPPVATSGTGVGVVSLNTTSHELRVKTTFSGLTGTTTASHVHCCAAPGANAGVATQTPSFAGFPAGVTAGSYEGRFDTTQAASWNAAFITASGGTPAGAELALLNGLNAGQAYLNIHTSTAAGGEIRANLQRFSFVPAVSGRLTGLAYALDSLGAGSGMANERLVAMAMMTPAEQAVALAELAPLPTTVTAATLTNGLYSDYDQISNRLGGLRGDGAHGLWLRYADTQNELDLSARLASAESDGEVLAAGLDHQLESGLSLGISLSLAEDEVDHAGTLLGTSGDLDGWRTTFYAEQRFGAAFVEGMFTLGHSDVSHVRSLGANGLAAAESASEQWGARLALGADVALGASAGFTPQLRIDYSNLELDDYQESAPSGLGLTVLGQEFDSARFSLGGQFDLDIEGGISPFIRVFWNHEFESGDTFTRASFANSPVLFEVSDNGPGDSGYTAGIGVNFTSGANFGAALSYDLVDSDDFESELVQARVLWQY